MKLILIEDKWVLKTAFVEVNRELNSVYVQLKCEPIYGTAATKKVQDVSKLLSANFTIEEDISPYLWKRYKDSAEILQERMLEKIYNSLLRYYPHKFFILKDLMKGENPHEKYADAVESQLEILGKTDIVKVAEAIFADDVDKADEEKDQEGDIDNIDVPVFLEDYPADVRPKVKRDLDYILTQRENLIPEYLYKMFVEFAAYTEEYLWNEGLLHEGTLSFLMEKMFESEIRPDTIFFREPPQTIEKRKELTKEVNDIKRTPYKGTSE